MRQYIWAAAAGAALLAVGAAYLAGRSQERTKWELMTLEEYQETRERIDNATDGLDTPDAIDDRLRELAE